MTSLTRRDLFSNTAKGMLLAGLGLSVSQDLGIAPAWAAEEPARLTFGAMEPLVDFLAQTPPEKIIPACIAKIRAGTSLRELVAGAALANARAFGGEDYVGFHTLMALAPAWTMSQEEGTTARSSLPVLKVLFRNANRLKERGTAVDTLAALSSENAISNGENIGNSLRDAARSKDLRKAEHLFAVQSKSSNHGIDELMEMVDDGAEVHRTVLVAKSLELAGFVGTGNAHTLLRQSVHYCVKNEASAGYVKQSEELRKVVPALLDRHQLHKARAGTKQMDEAWVLSFAMTVLGATPSAAAEAVAMALAEGILPEHIGEALGLGSNHLVLRDQGRQGSEIQQGKPQGSVHGDSIGVHSGDSTHAWRNIARAGNARTLHASLILAGYQLARDRGYRGKEILTRDPVDAPLAGEIAAKLGKDDLLDALKVAIRSKDQARATAIVNRMGAIGLDSARVKGVLRSFATTEDGALHAEKYYRTACDDFQTTREGLRWRHLAGLARVTASAYGFKAPGIDEAASLLGV